MSKPAALTDLLLTGRFRSGPGYWTQRPRGTGDYLIILTTAGAGRFAFGEREFVAHTGDVVVYRPGAVQDYRTAAGEKVWGLVWSHFLPRVHWLEWLNWPEALTDLMHVRLGERVYREVKSEMEDMHRYASSGRGVRGREWAMTALERAILLTAGSLPEGRGAMMDERVARVMERLSEGELRAEVDWEALAGSVGLSLSRLQHLFREQTGKTLLGFAEDRRLELGRRLLAGTNLSVKEIAGKCGYASPFYFSLRFKAATGKSPLHWRDGR